MRFLESQRMRGKTGAKLVEEQKNNRHLIGGRNELSTGGRFPLSHLNLLLTNNSSGFGRARGVVGETHPPARFTSCARFYFVPRREHWIPNQSIFFGLGTSHKSCETLHDDMKRCETLGFDMQHQQARMFESGCFSSDRTLVECITLASWASRIA